MNNWDDEELRKKAIQRKRISLIIAAAVLIGWAIAPDPLLTGVDDIVAGLGGAAALISAVALRDKQQ